MYLFPVAGVHPRIYFPWQVWRPPPGWRSFAQHKEKCIATDINPLPERTFYRWRSEEENAFKRSEEFDASLHFLSRPIRHQSQISGFRNQLGADRTYGRVTMVDKEPVLRTKNGRSFAFSPEWYPDLRRKWRGEGERSWRSEREGMTRTMKGKFHPPPTWTVVTGMFCLHHS